VRSPKQKLIVSSVSQVTPGISTSQLPSLTKVLGESHLSSFVLERWAQRHIQKRYAVAPVCPLEDDLKEQDWLLGGRHRQGETKVWVAYCEALHSRPALCQFPTFLKKMRTKFAECKQGHTPSMFSEPPPLARLLFLEAFLS
jgi:hypothetical protein